MPYYSLAQQDVLDLVSEAITKWHPDLVEAKVAFGVLMAFSKNEKPAVTHGGYGARATVRIIGIKDRLTKKYDAEILIDAELWSQNRREHNIALIDHELSHVGVKRTKPKKVKKKAMVHGDDEEMNEVRERQEEEGRGEIMKDDLGRPQLRLNKGDWNGGDGFSAVVQRHGHYAPEVENADALRARVELALTDGGHAVVPAQAGKLTIPPDQPIGVFNPDQDSVAV